MPTNNQSGFTVTLRDVYDLLQEMNEQQAKKLAAVDTTLAKHTIEDERRFARLNSKVYGVLVSLLLGFGSVSALLAHSHGF